MGGFVTRIRDALTGGTAGVRGLVFVPLADEGAMARAAPGQIVRNPTSGPPWIVVDHAVESVVAARWPGRLWEVEIVEAAAEQPREGAGYTRAVDVRVLREIPIAILFGPRGGDVVRVIERAASIDAEAAAELGARSAPLASEAYSRAWNAWLAKVEPGSIHLGAGHADTLSVHAGGTRSPIGGAFTVLHSVLSDRARAVAGDAAFITDEDGESCLAEPWSTALAALLHAAMAFGAPELVPDADRHLLLKAWDHCFERG